MKHKDPALNSKIFHGFIHGQSNRQISSHLQVSEHAVRIRLTHMARRALLFHKEVLNNQRIKESIAYDGLENFAGSQYDPNNIQHAIGADTLFIYDFNFAPLNRKGRMSKWQKSKLAKIEEDQGRYDPSSIRKQSMKIFKRLEERGVVELLSDEHFQYKRALRQMETNLQHRTISSKACRNFQNILFSVNHADLLVRQRIAAFARETISFAKTAGSMCQKYALFMVHRNYMKPQFSKKHVRREFAHCKSPAEHAGLCKSLLGFKDVFSKNPNIEAADRRLNEDWCAYFRSEVPKDCLRNTKFKRRVT